jgi:phosphonate transport system substrate-binding protein
MALFMLNSAYAAEPAGQKPLILAVHPYLPKDEIISRFKPLADYIARATGRPVQVRVGRDYEEHIDAIGTDSVDIAYMGPVPYVKLVAKYGKKPLLVRQEIDDQPLLKGEIIVRQDSPLQSLSELKGKRFIFTDPDSTMGSVIPQKVLIQAGVPLTSLAGYKFVEGHDNVALAVLAGDYDAGAVKEETFQKYAPKGLRVLAHSPPVYDHLLVTSTRLPAELVGTLRIALLKLNGSPEGKAVMAAIHPRMTALAASSDSEYDTLRAILGLKILTTH